MHRIGQLDRGGEQCLKRPGRSLLVERRDLLFRALLREAFAQRPTTRSPVTSPAMVWQRVPSSVLVLGLAFAGPRGSMLSGARWSDARCELTPKLLRLQLLVATTVAMVRSAGFRALLPVLLPVNSRT